MILALTTKVLPAAQLTHRSGRKDLRHHYLAYLSRILITGEAIVVGPQRGKNGMPLRNRVGSFERWNNLSRMA